MDRRLKAYREQNVHDSGSSVQCFFKHFVANVLLLNGLEKEEHNLGALKEFIEQKGAPCSLNLITEKDQKFLRRLERLAKPQLEESKGSLSQRQDEDSEDEVTQLIRREEEEARKRADDERERKRVEALEAEQRRLKEEQERVKLEQIREQERDLLDTRSQPIRQYLMDNVVPHLTQGLIELCKKVPEEPGEWLAEFLIRRADEIDQRRVQEREAAIKAKLEAKAARHKTQ